LRFEGPSSKSMNDSTNIAWVRTWRLLRLKKSLWPVSPAQAVKAALQVMAEWFVLSPGSGHRVVPPCSSRGITAAVLPPLHLSLSLSLPPLPPPSHLSVCSLCLHLSVCSLCFCVCLGCISLSLSHFCLTLSLSLVSVSLCLSPSPSLSLSVFLFQLNLSPSLSLLSFLVTSVSLCCISPLSWLHLSLLHLSQQHLFPFQFTAFPSCSLDHHLA